MLYTEEFLGFFLRYKFVLGKVLFVARELGRVVDYSFFYRDFFVSELFVLLGGYFRGRLFVFGDERIFYFRELGGGVVGSEILFFFVFSIRLCLRCRCFSFW